MQEFQASQSQSHQSALKAVLLFLRSMRFSFLLLFIILAACVAGSIIPQGQTAAVYEDLYGPRGSGLILGFGLDHVFTCVWFILLAALLCLNLIFCSLSRFPTVYRAWKAAGNRRQIGVWGSWITHLGLLLLILSFAASQYTSREESFYGIAGSTHPVGDTGLTVTIEDFTVDLREDFTVSQYIAALTVRDSAGLEERGEASVNHPFDACGYSFYQDSMGWANYVDIYKNGDLVKTDLICVGEYTFPDDRPSLVLLLNTFYPDLAKDAEQGYYSETPLLNNPHSLYSFYYDGALVTMGLTEPGVPIDVHEYRFVLRDPVEYTLIVAKTDPAAPLVFISALILLAGLFICFYVKPLEQERRKKHADKSDA